MNKQINEWLEDAEWMVAVEEYDFSFCETMQNHIKEAVELFKSVLESQNSKPKFTYEPIQIDLNGIKYYENRQQCQCDKACIGVDENGNLKPKECATWFTEPWGKVIKE